MDSLLTVVVPVYNAERYLDDCVRSILTQTYKNIELILVDDGSPDDSLTLCRKWQQADSRVRVIHQENAGPGAARNTGIGEARGRYIAFVDSDDTVAATMYERMIALAQEHGADMVCSNLYRVEDETGGVLVMDRTQALRNRLNAQDISDSTVDKVYDRRLFEELRYPTDRSLSEDSALVYKLISACQTVVYTSEAFYQIRPIQNSLSRSRYERRFTSTIDTYEEMVEFFCSTKEAEFEHIAIRKAVGAVLFNAGEYACARCRDKEAKAIIRRHARWQLKNYELGKKNKMSLLMAAYAFGVLGLLYQYKKRGK